MTEATATGQDAALMCPRGVTGKQREQFLSLTPTQRETYRYHFDVCGRLAQHCYLIAVGKLPAPRY